MVLILWVSVVFSVIANFITPTDGINYNAFLVFVIPLLVFLTVFSWKGFLPFILMYANMTSVVGFMWVLNVIEPTILNFIFFYFVIALSTLYQHKKAIYYTSFLVLLASAHIYFFAGNRELIFYQASHLDYFYILCSFIFISLIILAQTTHSGLIQRRIQEEREYAENLREKSEQSNEQMALNGKAVSDFSAKLHQNVTTTKERSDDMTVSAKEMANGFSIQVDAMLDVEQMFSFVNQDIQTVSNSTDEMFSFSHKTIISTEQGHRELASLENEMASVQRIIRENVSTMKELSTNTNEIMTIMNVINDVSNQINLLSLNASIEAARAGEQGKGFAVVASEVKKLAEYSKKSVHDIQAIVVNLKEKTNVAFHSSQRGSETFSTSQSAFNQVKNSFQAITDNTTMVLHMSKDIQKLVKNLHASSATIVEQITNSSVVTRQHTVSIQHMFENIEKQNEQLQEIIHHVRLLEEQVQKFY